MSGADPATTLVWSALSGFAMLTCLVPLDFVLPSLAELGWCLALGIAASTGQYLMVLAYRHAGASLLAPFSYSQMVYAVLLGYLVFGALPDGWTLVGAAVITASGIYTVHRERVRAREGRQPRSALKKSRSSAPASPSRTPPTTSGLCRQPAAANTRAPCSTPPPLGS
jgi:drug/metabolite transporter (DMT)-like permease